MRRERHHALTVLGRCHDGSKIAHGFRVLVCVCDGRQCSWASVILRQGHDVCPDEAFAVVGVLRLGRHAGRED